MTKFHRLGPTPQQDLTSRLEAVPDTLRPDEPRDRAGRVLIWSVVALAVVLIGGVAWLVLGGRDVVAQRDAATAQAVAVADPVLELCARGDVVAHALQEKGACAPAEQVRAEPIPGTPGATGADGKPGRDGIDGKPGRDGIDGKPGLDGKDGVDGKDGKDGVDGLPGVDGKDGRDGKDGADGRDGVNGAPSPPPAGFTFTDSSGRPAQTCARDATSPDSAPTYTCTTPAGAPSSTPSLLRLTDMR